jgi:hypothetical protein
LSHKSTPDKLAQVPCCSRQENDADGLLERFLGLENVPDDVLAAGVEWMGLAA